MVHHNIYFYVFLYDFDFCLQFDKDEVQGLFNIGTESWAPFLIVLSLVFLVAKHFAQFLSFLGRCRCKLNP
jgi:hypothetical protein